MSQNQYKSLSERRKDKLLELEQRIDNLDIPVLHTIFDTRKIEDAVWFYLNYYPYHVKYRLDLIREYRSVLEGEE